MGQKLKVLLSIFGMDYPPFPIFRSTPPPLCLTDPLIMNFFQAPPLPPLLFNIRKTPYPPCTKTTTSATFFSCFLILSREGGWVSYQLFKDGGLTGSQFLEEGWWERGGWLSEGGCSFYIKSKLKSEIFNEKKKIINKKNLFCLN